MRSLARVARRISKASRKKEPVQCFGKFQNG